MTLGSRGQLHVYVRAYMCVLICAYTICFKVSSSNFTSHWCIQSIYTSCKHV